MTFFLFVALLSLAFLAQAHAKSPLILDKSVGTYIPEDVRAVQSTVVHIPVLPDCNDRRIQVYVYTVLLFQKTFTECLNIRCVQFGQLSVVECSLPVLPAFSNINGFLVRDDTNKFFIRVYVPFDPIDSFSVLLLALGDCIFFLFAVLYCIIATKIDNDQRVLKMFKLFNKKKFK